MEQVPVWSETEYGEPWHERFLIPRFYAGLLNQAKAWIFKSSLTLVAKKRLTGSFRVLMEVSTATSNRAISQTVMNVHLVDENELKKR
jgi:hypothetical protein